MKFYIVFMIFAVEVLFGQIKEKHQLTTKDYELWESFTSTAMSADGKWVYYGLQKKEQDTLFLCSTVSEKRLAFPNANWPTFSQKSRWFAFYQENSLQLADLRTLKTQVINHGVLNYIFSDVDSYLLVFLSKGSSTTLQVLDLKTMQSSFIQDIKSYVVSPDKKRVAVVIKNNGIETIKVLTLNATLKESVIITTEEDTFEGLKWDALGNKLAFFKESKKGIEGKSKVVLYWSKGFDSKVIYKTLDVSNNPIFPEKSVLKKFNLHLETSSNNVFFTIQQDVDSLVDVKKHPTLQIWKSGDLTIPPKSENAIITLSLKWYLWDTNSYKITAIEDDLHPHSIYMNTIEHALVYNPDALASNYKNSDEVISMYVKNLVSGIKRPLLDEFITAKGTIFVSPTGKYIAYFKNKDWWIYDVYKETHRCLTQGMSLSWHRLDYDKPSIISPTHQPAWTINDAELIIYDQYDVWLLKPDGTLKKRLTNGTKTNTVYRIYNSILPSSPNFYSYGFLTHEYDLNTKILLKTINEVTLAEGFAILHTNGKVQHLLERESTLNLVSTSAEKKDFLFVEQNFSLPPRLLYVSAKGVIKTIYQSNLQQERYNWGKSELIYYTTKEVKHLKGVLFYPDNYNSSKKYPLLVSIYEKKSGEVFNYTVPSMYNDSGFNVSNYVSDGYFVLYPDISYVVNSPGASALNCVTAAVLKVIEDYSIDENKIGLIGHSFGGYETAYIMGQTDLFRTAVVGAPAIDLLSNYLTLDGHGKSNMWRYEMDQIRITAPFYSEVFEQNSPLKFVKNISAPILTWTGTGDLQVDWLNSMKFHSALWRLDKMSTLLVYPNEGHVFDERKNQLDLTTKIKDWLDYYLKGKVKGEWMEE